jgi:hypothetical protein
MYGFCGYMPSWMGACGWLGILFSYIGELTCKTMVDKKAEYCGKK